MSVPSAFLLVFNLYLSLEKIHVEVVQKFIKKLPQEIKK